MLMGWVFDLSWSFGLIHTNLHVGEVMGTRRRCISRSSSDVSNGVARTRVVRNGIDLVVSDARTDLGRPRIVQECKG